MSKPRKKASPAPVNGRERLIEAAVRLAARNGGIGAIGMRELAREAGLNPNTFYRHFSNFDELGVAAVATTLPELREGLREMRTRSDSIGDNITHTVRYFFGFVEKNPEAITVATRELYGPSSRTREALCAGIDGLTGDLSEAMVSNRWADAASGPELADVIIKYLMSLAIDYVHYPARRAGIVDRSERFILLLFAGSQAVRALGLQANSPMVPRLARLLAPPGVVKPSNEASGSGLGI